jgi:hypothetical protein
MCNMTAPKKCAATCRAAKCNRAAAVAIAGMLVYWPAP